MSVMMVQLLLLQLYGRISFLTFPEPSMYSSITSSVKKKKTSDHEAGSWVGDSWLLSMYIQFLNLKPCFNVHLILQSVLCGDHSNSWLIMYVGSSEHSRLLPSVSSADLRHESGLLLLTAEFTHLVFKPHENSRRWSSPESVWIWIWIWILFGIEPPSKGQGELGVLKALNPNLKLMVNFLWRHQVSDVTFDLLYYSKCWLN